LGAVVWCGLPLAAYWQLTGRAAEETFERPVAVDGPVKANSGASRRDVALALTWYVPGPVVAPGWDGVVQSVGAAPGRMIASGEVLARVDGVDRLACASASPMARSVALRDKGRDVATLHECLTAAGYDVAVDKDVYGSATKSAVADLAAKTGAASERGEVFDAAWLVFLPEENYWPQTVDLVVGAPAPPAGSALASAAPVLSQAVLADADYLDSVELVQPLAGEAASAGPVASPTEALVAEPGETLIASGVEITLSEDRAGVAADDLEVLQSKVAASSPVVAASLERAANADEYLVPADAVIATADGGTCVLRVEGAALRPVAVEILGNASGNSIAKGDLKAGQKVRIAPEPKDRQCGPG
jgi:hypothetical protein